MPVSWMTLEMDCYRIYTLELISNWRTTLVANNTIILSNNDMSMLNSARFSSLKLKCLLLQVTYS